MTTCDVCGLSREEHNDSRIHHQFNTEGELIPKKDPRKAALGRQLTSPTAEAILLRLVSVLSARGLLSDKDVALVMGAPDGRLAEGQPAPRDSEAGGAEASS